MPKHNYGGGSINLRVKKGEQVEFIHVDMDKAVAPSDDAAYDLGRSIQSAIEILQQMINHTTNRVHAELRKLDAQGYKQLTQLYVNGNKEQVRYIIENKNIAQNETLAHALWVKDWLEMNM